MESERVANGRVSLEATMACGFCSSEYLFSGFSRA